MASSIRPSPKAATAVIAAATAALVVRAVAPGDVAVLEAQGAAELTEAR